MNPIKKILVGLDTTEMDKTLIRFATAITDHSATEKVYFVNIIRNLNVPDDVQKEFPQLIENALEDRKKEIKETISKGFSPNKAVKIECIIDRGAATKTIMNLATKLDIDLIVIGQKSQSPGSGVLIQRLARRASCNLLIVPEDAEFMASKILVPVDFSEYSKLALERSIDIALKNEGKTEIICQNVYAVPQGYHYTGKSFKEFGELMKSHAEKDFDKFVEEINTDGIHITPIYSMDQNDNLASDIIDLAEEKKVDGIIIGAKGRTAAAAIFLGSMAEKLINYKLKLPMMVARPKGKTAGIIESLKEIK